ncbi:hypothetical protein DQG23_33005 [Paenibacillus contaminans]|uniref:Uncharacterized protein n=2 Tax=Paenibacillus contaminans TaxID=450362 RepID=A0A329M1Y6_9BACL|nr:hypothetical protein DQG23_33005 [Paenibacillus contaminans]
MQGYVRFAAMIGGIFFSLLDFYPFFENIISEAVMSIRHYITAQEPVQHLCDGRLKRWVLKPLCVAMRIERLIITGKYPHNFNELLEMSAGLPQVKAVEWIMNKELFTQNVSADPTKVLGTLLELATSISERVANFRD